MSSKDLASLHLFFVGGDNRRGAIVCRTVPGNPGRDFESAEALLYPTRVESQQFDRLPKTFLDLPG